jgi:hypothetical protein
MALPIRVGRGIAEESSQHDDHLDQGLFGLGGVLLALPLLLCALDRCRGSGGGTQALSQALRPLKTESFL